MGEDRLNRSLKISALVIVIVLLCVWIFAQVRANQPNPAVDNGVSDYIPMPTESEREMFQRMPRPRSDRRNMTEEDRVAMREEMQRRFEEMSPEEREAMQERWRERRERFQRIRSSLSPEEQAQFRQKMFDAFRRYRQEQDSRQPSEGESQRQ